MMRDTGTNERFSELSEDIRLLGNLLGDIIRQQHGDDALALVERVRAEAKARRKDDSRAASALGDLIADLDLNQKRILTKAFSNYFQLINIAEDQQRIRVLRQRERAHRLDESIEAAIQDLKRAGLTADDVRALLNSISVRLVLTAHPSEAKRKEVLVKLRDIAQLMLQRDQLDLLPREARTLEQTLMRRVEELWQTRPTRASRATVADEVDFGVYFITSVVMDVVVDIYDDLQMSLEQHYPGEDWSALPPLLRYASWIGGDRDGNPNVTPEVTLQTLQTLREAVRQVYISEVAYLRDRLTQAVDEAGVSPQLLRSLQHNLTPGSFVDKQYHGELYRQKMDSIHKKLLDNGYTSGTDLLDDLNMVAESLRQNQGVNSTGGTFARLRAKVKLFGMHLLPLDIREDSRKYAAALDEIFRHYRLSEDYLKLGETEKQALLTREIANPRPLFPIEPRFSHDTNLVIQTWRMIATAHKTFGTVVIDSVIASMSQNASDVLTMLLLAHEVGIQDHVDIVPLFETIDDLQGAPDIMQALFVNPEYAKHLAARGYRQQIMIGYSDSNKDGGYLASNWNLYTAQTTLAETCANVEINGHQGVTLELFHGRGGSIGRGGGPTNRAILSQPPATMMGPIKITEQGEVIAYRYSNADIARRHLHQVMHAVLLAASGKTAPKTKARPEWRAAMDLLSEYGRVAYRKFVYETTGFLEYWQHATPINELARMPIGSRPAKRTKGGFESIRAIPWVFSWMQSRAIIPSWYGVGYALESFCAKEEGGLALLQEMYREWRFFEALVENVQLDLAKADMGIASLYASLVGDTRLRGAIFGEMQREHTRARDYICKVLEQEELLGNMPVLRRSIERRNPYVDPLNFIQVALLRELRESTPGTAEYEALLNAVLATVNGIAAGMKTTG
ncbi:MAG: phosphoenolpyruvate carboxylase [Chloroflexi bacterium]|nr:phosphoenolpyruvate carboxylase [Chloroflexota bacterium]